MYDASYIFYLYYFFFNDTATTETYTYGHTLSLHDALPISRAPVDNARQIQQGTLESGFVQSDIAYWAYHVEELFLTGGPLKSLRAISNLYPETIHLVVSAEADIESDSDIKVKRISHDRPGSATRVDAQLVLRPFGIAESNRKSTRL